MTLILSLTTEQDQPLLMNLLYSFSSVWLPFVIAYCFFRILIFS